MSETKPIPIRLSDDLIKRLDDVSAQLGSNRAAVARFCVQTFVEYFERHGSACLPPNWKDILASLDNRTALSKTPLARTVDHGFVLNDDKPSVSSAYDDAQSVIEESVKSVVGAQRKKKRSSSQAIAKPEGKESPRPSHGASDPSSRPSPKKHH